MTYPSVTTIITMHLDKTWLESHPEYAYRGTMVHRACESYIKGCWVMPMAKDHQPYYESFRAWAEENKPEPVKTEIYLEDKDIGFCGHPDFIGYIKNDGKNGKQLGVLDWKTSRQASPWWRLQIAAYRHLFNITYGESLGITEWGADILLKSDGEKADTHAFPRPRRKTDWQEDLDTFMSLAIIYRHLNNIENKKEFDPIIKRFKQAVDIENKKESTSSSTVTVIRNLVSKGISAMVIE